MRLTTTPTFAPESLQLQFFDLNAIIYSDSIDYINIFSQMYQRFREGIVVNEGTMPYLEFTVLTGHDNPWQQPVLILDGEVQPLSNPKLLTGYIYDGVLNTMVAKVRSHFLIHAGVVAKNGQGILLVADAGHGKTTLVLELVRRGFRFLSDEMAALNRDSYQVDPFPRSLRIRSGSLDLVGFSLPTETPVWLGKYLVDIEDIQPDCLGSSAKINHIIILQDPTEPEIEHVTDSEREMGVLVDQLTDELLQAVQQLDGVIAVQADTERGYPTLRFRSAERMAVLTQIERICHEKRILILDISKRIERQPSFDSPPKLESIPKSQAIIQLLRRFQGGHKSALLQKEFNGSSTRLFMELALLVDQAQCYRLSVGPLQQAANLVSDLIHV